MKTKLIKSVAMLISILMIFSSLFVLASATNSATISAEQTGYAKPGQTVTIPVKISNNPGIMGFSVSVKYDKTVLTPVYASAGTIINGLFDDSIETSEPGSFDVVWSGTENCTQNGILFNVTFDVNSNASGTTKIELSYSQADTFNENWQDVVLNCEDIDLAIENQQTGESTLTVGNVTTIANKTVAVPVSVSGNGLAKKLNINIDYDNNVLIPKSVSDGNYNAVSDNVSNADGTLTIELVSDTPQSGVAVSVEFFVKSEADGIYNLNASSVSAKCISGSISVSTPDGIAYVFANDFEALRGEAISVPIKISNNPGVMGYRLTFAYDDSAVTPVSAVSGEGFSGNFDNSIGIKSNIFDVVWSNSSDNTTNGNIIVLTFKIKETASLGKSTVAISYTQEDTFNEEWNDVKLGCSDFIIDIKSVKIDNEKDTLKVGETLHLTASSDTLENILWSSSDETVAKVDANGKVTAVGSGTVTITAKNANGSESITIQIIKSYICPDCGDEVLGEDAINEHIATEARMKATVKIKNNSGSKTINYGETLRLTATTTNMPTDAKIYWYVDGVWKGEGETFNVSFENGTKTVEVKLVDANGNVLKDSKGNELSDLEEVSVKTGFFQKLISFFKNLFKVNRTVVQSVFKGVF